MPRVYIGYDAREWLAWQVCATSLQATSKYPVSVRPIGRTALVASGNYTRTQSDRNGIQFDDISNAPCSTDFSLARFWVPAIDPYSGWALFCDGDFLWRRDVHELFELRDSRYAVMVVKHDHQPTDATKMDGQQQTTYPRKNWSSLCLWNMNHAASRRLNHYKLNTLPGRDLHRFCWLRDEEIGGLPEAWNWLDGHSDPTLDPAAVHFTRGTPDMPGWEFTRHSAEWCRYAQVFARKAA